VLGRLRAVANTPTPPTSAVPDCTQSPCAQVPAPTKHTWNRRPPQPARRTARLSQVATSGTVLIWFGMGRHCAMAGVHTDRNIGSPQLSTIARVHEQPWSTVSGVHILFA
jgi:hypothetical protein